jgi:hypothetical protein
MSIYSLVSLAPLAKSLISIMSDALAKQCPICGRTLKYEHKQFRSDDEPATLVVGCDIHGSTAELVLQLFSDKNRKFISPSSIRAEHKAALDANEGHNRFR